MLKLRDAAAIPRTLNDIDENFEMTDRRRRRKLPKVVPRATGG